MCVEVRSPIYLDTRRPALGTHPLLALTQVHISIYLFAYIRGHIYRYIHMYPYICTDIYICIHTGARRRATPI